MTRFAAVFAFAVAAAAHADITLPSVVSSGMVLQRGTDARIWGRADADEEVRVRADWLEKPVVVTAGRDGSWSCTLDTRGAVEGPRTITVSGKNTLTLRDVLLGEVWLCSGQSNMEWPLVRCAGGEQAAAEAKDANIRVFKVPNTQSVEERFDSGGAWASATGQDAAQMSGVAYFFARSLREELGVPVGIVQADWGGTRIEAWMSAEALRAAGGSSKELETLDAAKVNQNTVTALHGGMIAPISELTIAGINWYQGESNLHNAEAYEGLLEGLITSWRSEFEDARLPFNVVQIAPFDYKNDRGEAATLREAQARAAMRQRASLIVTLDVGDPKDIHPAEKQTVGERLAQAAKAVAYEGKDVEEGEIYPDVSFPAKWIAISSELAPSEDVRGIEIAGDDRVFRPAKARTHRRTVMIDPAWPGPITAVRYAWCDACEANLKTEDGRPVPPFRTDTWKLGEWSRDEDTGMNRFGAVEEGFEPLLTSKDLPLWETAGEPGHWAMQGWVLAYDGKGDHLKTKKEYGDFELVCDWRLPGTPVDAQQPIVLPDGSYELDAHGQQVKETIKHAGDSGIYLRGTDRSQVNIWCWSVGSGELWGVRNDPNVPAAVRAAATPKQRADAPPGEWNRFRIVMKGDRVTVDLNGVRVIEDAQIPGVNARGPILLQHHGDALEFANIYVKELR
jgi:sialate O-acetylesterase